MLFQIHLHHPRMVFSGCIPSCPPLVPLNNLAPLCGGLPAYGGCGYGLGCGIGYGYLSSGLVGPLSGANTSCVSQIPPSEVVIQPPPSVVTIPGPILSASCEPVAVGGNTPCAVGSYGSGYGLSGLGHGYGLGSGYGLGYGLGCVGYGPGAIARTYGRRAICSILRLWV
uniref:Uncharacterized protein n=1 Tax=Sphenodon punctatus TaxID=8508 RepID=A0A8D0HK14_SPHPU